MDQDVTVKVILDFVLLIIVAVPILIFKVAIQPFQRGFFCNDESISYPYKDSTISTLALFLTGFLVPLGCMIPAEAFLWWRAKQSNTAQGHNYLRTAKEYTIFRKPVPVLVVNLYKIIGAFLFGAAVCQCTTDIFKYSLGRLRPHFLSLCQPDYTKISCVKDGHPVYVVDFTCTGTTDHDLLKESRLSHVSGHASFSAYTMVYLALYIQAKLTWRGSLLLRRFFQVVFVLLSVGCCLSRVSDYKHHWSDVLGGALLGVTVAVLTAFFVSNLFVLPTWRNLRRLLHADSKKSDGYGTTESVECSTVQELRKYP